MLGENNYSWIVAPVLVFLGAIIGKVIDYFVSKSKGSGTIQNSEASTLWTASQLFLQEVLEQLKASREEIVALRQLNTQLQDDLKEITTKAENWQHRAQTLEDELSDLELRFSKEIKSHE